MHQDQMPRSPIWKPTPAIIHQSNIHQLMKRLGHHSVESFHTWTITRPLDFWRLMIDELQITFGEPLRKICDMSGGAESPSWFPDATLNIADSCFNASDAATAIVYANSKGILQTLTYGELNSLSNRVANGLVDAGYRRGDTVGICMPLTYQTVAIYLGILKMGGVVVSIADSFSTQEIQTRLEIANAKVIITQDVTLWGGKKLELFKKVSATNVAKIIVVATEPDFETIRNDVTVFTDLLSDDTTFESVQLEPMAPAHILFSSGTTSAPKAIVWHHVTPIKAASDAFFHQNIQAGDVLCWPTNLGWMMGPWLIFAALINQATLALYTEVPKDEQFGKFVQDTKVTMLGVVPTLVAFWRQTKCMEKLNWNSIKVLSSTGECSNPDDMTYLSTLAGHKPIIEYCGGTEIGGAYISSTVVQDNYASIFSTPTMGMHIEIMDEKGNAADHGEVTIVPPSIGLSTRLLNGDHHKVYYADMPLSADGKIRRRHGDEIRRMPNGMYTIMGRSDDAMNLGGIKVSAAEIERLLSQQENIIEIAAVGVNPPQGGPTELVIFAATLVALDKAAVMKNMQHEINAHLNPLFKIHDVVFLEELPKTASNKIMRRVLRANYADKVS